MEIRVLRYFLAVCESKNISKAASVLHISQPSLSRQLKNLEQELGVTLFTRGPHEISLTEQGYYLRDHAQDIVNMVEKTKINITKEDVVSGELYIGAGESIAMKRIMQVIDSILKDYPDVRVNLLAGTAPIIESKIDNGNLDFGITMGHRKAGNYESLALPEKNEYGIVMRKDHPLASKDVLSAQDLADYPLIISKRTSISDNFRDFWGSSNLVNVAATFNLHYNAQFLVQNGNYCLFTYKV